MRLQEVLKALKQLGDPEVKKTKAHFAIAAEKSHGNFLKDLQILAKQIGPNDELAMELFDSGIYEARLLVPLLFEPDHLTSRLMEKWVKVFDNWEICDTFCMGFFGASPYAVEKAFRWADYPGEYQRRAGFVCMVSYAFINKEAPNTEIRRFFPVMLRHANDDRKYVMKGINWALRQVGKRNKDLHAEALEVAHQILALDTKPARWIATDALRQLQRPKVSMKNYPRSTYGRS